MDIRKIKKLIELVEESGIAELEIAEGEESVRISRATAPIATVAAAPVAAVAAPAPAPVAAAAPAAEAAPAAAPGGGPAGAPRWRAGGRWHCSAQLEPTHPGDHGWHPTRPQPCAGAR